jgi:5-methylcytosine-specific restriction endonuclease McrA
MKMKGDVWGLGKIKSPKLNFGIVSGKNNTRQHISTSDRWRIIERQRYKCKKCRKPFGEKIKPQYDHIKQVSKGGKKGRDLKNIQALCANCHYNKTIRERKPKRKKRSSSNITKFKLPKIRI